MTAKLLGGSHSSGSRPKTVTELGVDADLLLRLAQGGLDHVLPRVQGAAGERHLTGVRAHVVGALGEQQLAALGTLAEQHEYGAAAGVAVRRRHEPGQVGRLDVAGRLLDRPQPVGEVPRSASQADPEVLARRARRARRRSRSRPGRGSPCRRRRRTANAGTPRIEPGYGVVGIEVAARVGEQRIGHAGLFGRARARPRAAGPGSRPRSPGPGRRTSRRTPASAGISLRHGPHQDAQRLTTSGPRRLARSTSGPPPRQGRVRSGRPPSTGSPVPGTQSSMPAVGLERRAAAGCRRRSSPRPATGRRRRCSRSAAARPRRAQPGGGASCAALGLHQLGRGLGVGRALAVRRAPLRDGARTARGLLRVADRGDRARSGGG